MSTIDARREARRRKILENSGSRLQKITGVQERNTNFDIDGFKSIQVNGESHTDHQQLSEPFNNFVAPLPINAPLGPTSSSKPLEVSYFRNYRTVIVILIATFVNILSSLADVYNFQYVDKIFIPLLCFEAVWLFWKKEENNDNSFAKYLVLFRSNKGQQLVWIFKYLALLKSTFKDMVIYFFVFVSILYIRTIAVGS
ncbi:uncharacterized protein LOC109544645 [Dendroctonus ponderosae]|uniref:Ion transport domain-containing protein n=1 Tax=Dendroctonus ponderosae TaxID=77166 RepID=A0AAR5QBB4_DENPD|nr:uncharacterized protein LOC109544645 [Dendroctonus ponderosae]KAH1016305.1 hypothetical protein HUJ04_007550 [Dendroctonus ponderosae]KAH1025602.1 hypothetical protein HUJ05_010295 [Dendroctonus ponderosae]